MQGKSQLRLFCLVLFGTLLFFYLPWLSGKRSFYLSDTTYYFEPFCRFIGQALGHGHLPLWNPYAYCGMSQAAIPSPGIFSPFNLCFALMPFNQALSVTLALSQLAAGIGGFLLVAEWGVFAAWTCGLILALSGYMFSLQYNFTLVTTACWLPLALYCLQLLHKGRRGRWALLWASLSVFMLLAGGRPEIFAPAMLFLLSYIIATNVAARRENAQFDKGLIWKQLGALALGTLLAMPQLLPAGEWALISPRAHGLQTREVLLWSANWYDILSLFLRQPFGDLTLLGDRLLPLVETHKGYMPYLASAYVGPIALSLALIGALDKSWKWRSTLLFLLILSLVICLGDQTPLAPWILQIFPPMLLRYPVKLIFFVVFCLAVLAARGAFCLQEVKDQGKLLILISASLWTAVAVLGFLLPYLPITFAGTGDVYLTAQAKILLAQSAKLASIIGFIFCFFLIGFCQKRLRLPIFAFAVNVVLALSMLSCAFLFAHHDTEGAFFQRPVFMENQLMKVQALAQAAKDKRYLPLYIEPLECPVWYQGSSAQFRSADWDQYERQLLLPNTQIDCGLASSGGYEASCVGDYGKLLANLENKNAALIDPDSTIFADAAAKADAEITLARFCQMTATNFVFSQNYRQSRSNRTACILPVLSPKYFTLLGDDKFFNARIYAVRDVLPRVYFAKHILEARSNQTVIEQMQDPAHSGFDAGKFTYLDRLPPLLADSGANYSGSSSGTIERLSESAEEISFRVNVPRSALLVLADQYYPGWEATIDQAKVTILRANAVQRAVLVPAGVHVVTFKFVPASWYFGLLLFAGAALFLFVWLRLPEAAKEGR